MAFPQIIYLNGPSSSGKTTIGKALQESLREPFLLIGIDTIIDWMPEKINNWQGETSALGYSWKLAHDATGTPMQELQAGPYAQKMAEAFREVILALAKMDLKVIIDDVSFGKKEVDQWRKALKGISVLWVGITTPLHILEQREKTRGNRLQGSARAQFYETHRDVVYDLELDTHKTSVQEAVSKIQQFCSQPT